MHRRHDRGFATGYPPRGVGRQCAYRRHSRPPMAQGRIWTRAPPRHAGGVTGPHASSRYRVRRWREGPTSGHSGCYSCDRRPARASARPSDRLSSPSPPQQILLGRRERDSPKIRRYRAGRLVIDAHARRSSRRHLARGSMVDRGRRLIGVVSDGRSSCACRIPAHGWGSEPARAVFRAKRHPRPQRG